MKPKTMILMVVAIACGLGASYMTSRLLAERQTAQEESPKVTILVAKKNLDMGAPLKNASDLFEEKQVPQGEEPKDPVAAFEQMKGKYLKRALRKGDFITSADLIDEHTILELPAGMRAVGLRVTVETIAGGFASLPGSRVDILSTVRRGNDEKAQCRMLLQDVLVLAADTESRRRDDVNAMPANVVTVALTPEDAMKVTLAKEMGTLSLVLRRFGDKSSASLDKVSGDNGLTHVSAPPNKEPTVVVKNDKDIVPLPLPDKTKPQTPKVEKDPPKVEPKIEEPKFKRHVVTITEGNNTRKQVFLLNDKGQVHVDEVNQDQDPEIGIDPAPAPAAAPARKEKDKAPAKGGAVKSGASK